MYACGSANELAHRRGKYLTVRRGTKETVDSDSEGCFNERVLPCGPLHQRPHRECVRPVLLSGTCSNETGSPVKT